MGIVIMSYGSDGNCDVQERMMVWWTGMLILNKVYYCDDYSNSSKCVLTC